MAYEELTIEGRNAVIEAFRAGKTVDKIFVLEGYKDGPIQTVLREAKKQSTIVNFVKKERLDQLSETGKHQGVIEHLGAIIRTANQEGAHGVIIPKRRAVGLTATVAKASAGAIHYTPVAKVTNLVKTMEELKKQGMWFVCGDMSGETMYSLDLTGPIGVVIGNEGDGVSRLVKENCDFTASIPMQGDIDSLNASVAMGILSYEIVRQRITKGIK